MNLTLPVVPGPVSDDDYFALTNLGFCEDESGEKMVFDSRALGLNPLPGMHTMWRGMRLSEQEAYALADNEPWITLSTGELHYDDSIISVAVVKLLKDNGMI